MYTPKEIKKITDCAQHLCGKLACLVSRVEKASKV